MSNIHHAAIRLENGTVLWLVNGTDIGGELTSKLRLDRFKKNRISGTGATFPKQQDEYDQRDN